MARIQSKHVDQLRGGLRLALDAATGVTGIVERMHRTIQIAPGPLGKQQEDRTSGITGFVYRRVRDGFSLASGTLDFALRQLAAHMPQDADRSPDGLRTLGILNGLHGDHLERTDNPLALAMRLEAAASDAPDVESAGKPDAGQRRLIFIHGLCMSPGGWQRDCFNYGATLARTGDWAQAWLRYNSGLPIAENGRRLADLLERDSADVGELVLIGHSMGGLIARAACCHAEASGHRWRQRLTRLVFLGSPHHGAPLARGGHWFEQAAGLSPYVAPFLNIGGSRSAGIHDLRHGGAGSDDHQPLPEGVQAYAIAGALEGKMKRGLLGDGLVDVNSALGRHPDPTRDLGIPTEQSWVAHGVGHLDLLGDADVEARLEKWLI